MTTGMVLGPIWRCCNSIWIRSGHTFDAGTRQCLGAAVKPAEGPRGAENVDRVVLMQYTSEWRRQSGIWTAEQTRFQFKFHPFFTHFRVNSGCL